MKGTPTMCEVRKGEIVYNEKGKLMFNPLEPGGVESPETFLMLEIIDELRRAESIHPVWPNDPIYAAAIIGEEAGEVIKAVNNAVTGKKDGKDSDYRTEAVQCAAMCIRFLKNLDNFDWNTKY